MADTTKELNIPDLPALQTRAAELSRAAVLAQTGGALDSHQRQFLKGLGHRLKPVVQVGHHGLTPGLASATDKALDAHELIKIKLLETCPESHEVVALWLHGATGTAIVQIIGRVLLAYRPREKDPVIRLPR